MEEKGEKEIERERTRPCLSDSWFFYFRENVFKFGKNKVNIIYILCIIIIILLILFVIIIDSAQGIDFWINRRIYNFMGKEFSSHCA